MEKTVVKEQIVRITNKTFMDVVAESAQGAGVSFSLSRSGRAWAVVTAYDALYHVFIAQSDNGGEHIRIILWSVTDSKYLSEKWEEFGRRLSRNLKENLARRYNIIRERVNI